MKKTEGRKSRATVPLNKLIKEATVEKNNGVLYEIIETYVKI
jgi:hypothetical protein